MQARTAQQRTVPAWIKPPEEQAGLGRYLETLRERWWIVVLAVLITTGVAVFYVMTATKQYESTADLLVSPISNADVTLVDLPVLRESSDPTRAVETVARLVTNVDVAARVQDELGLESSPQDLLEDVSAEPVAQSNIVAVSGTADAPDAARDLANAFAQAAIDEQTDQLHAVIDQKLPELEARASGESATTAAGPSSATAALAALKALRSGPDPTLRVATAAVSATTPVSPRPALSIAAGFIAGLILGIGGAFASQMLDPRLRREDQLRRSYRLPILARIPKETRRGSKPLNPRELSPAAAEAYRTLRGLLAASRTRTAGDSRAILVTGSSASEGKTTTAINLATSFAAAGNSVILIEADLRRPAISGALEVTARHGVVGVLTESVALQDALVTVPALGDRLGVLLADYEGGWISELFALPAARELIGEARRLADYVVIDSPPLTDVIDALPLASYVDDVLVVCRVGNTDLRKLGRLGELLAENGIKPAGFAVVGTPGPKRSDYHYFTEERPLTDQMPRLASGQEPRSPLATGAQSDDR